MTPALVSARKLRTARLLDGIGVTRLLLRAQGTFWRRSIRIVYYHDVPEAAAAAFDRQLSLLRKYFVPASPEDLSGLLSSGRWPHERPGVIVTFDDGLRSHYEVAAPLLEKHGMTGWFFVPVGLVLLPEAEQPEAAHRNLVLHDWDTTREPRVFLSVAQLRDLARRHVVGCHSDTHVRLRADLDDGQLRAQIPGAQATLARLIGRPVDSFGWVGGEEPAYGAGAARHVADRFRLGFTTNSRAVRAGCSPLALDRTHLEADFPDALVRFQLSGLMDLGYVAKRRRLAPILNPSANRAADPVVAARKVP